MFNGMDVILPRLPKEMGGGLEVVTVLEAPREDPV